MKVLIHNIQSRLWKQSFMEGMGRMKENKKPHNLYTWSWNQSYFSLQSNASVQTSSATLASVTPAVSACVPWRGAGLGKAASSKWPLWGSWGLPLTSAFPRRHHRSLLENSNWLLPFSPLIRGMMKFGSLWTLTNFSFVMYANFPSTK